MSWRQNKRGFELPANFTALIILATVILVVSVTLLTNTASHAKEPVSDQICEGSIAARIKIGQSTGNIVDSPFLCKTWEHNFPKQGKLKKEDVMMAFAKDMEKCWDKMGRGLGKNIFQEGEWFHKDDCFICYTDSVKAWEGYKPGDKISYDELIKFLKDTPYEVKDTSDNCKNNQGYCVSQDTLPGCQQELSDKKIQIDDLNLLKIDKNSPVCISKYKEPGKEKKNCCYTPSSFCLGQGGECVDSCSKDYAPYTSWSCPSGKKCCVKEENYVKYQKA